MNQKIKRLLNKFRLHTRSELRYLENELSIWRSGFVPPGHYYSPLNDLTYLKKNEASIFSIDLPIKDIDLRKQQQFELLQQLLPYYKKAFFPEEKSTDYRYYFNNIFYSYSDGIFLFCLLNYWQPKRIIEIGSGFSSALMLDTNQHCFNNSMQLTFIEPFPEERLNNLIRPGDAAYAIKDFIQQVDLSLFTKLEAGDVLFVDSSHVSKFNSDLNHIIFQILPTLKAGVYIHFHDIFYPFEYPKEWILSGRAWSEAYMLRAFLMNNADYEIVLFPSMLEHFHEEWLQQNMPLTLKLHEKWPSEENFSCYLPNKGQSFWIKKVR
jgi:hypothetical protein